MGGHFDTLLSELRDSMVHVGKMAVNAGNPRLNAASITRRPGRSGGAA
ncbi:hypothetical protein L541_2922 [Bordetella hinzii CA90 BAL1384]|uniref:Uncharacterized protein n=1 Tax=Bordetella hinzii OH87 BAL007II TaxID=1331262 RepID=A0ABR4QUI2_9BORD|nr:hypothetical protein L544_2677 [Bordetella hinzii OH87 BAL007II]KCB32303.1 hypothetical protein L541_2922 [Bordetella hinzii CA90 BAL1384]KCB40488.1 hypothetical protein L539_3147 [Bordetella hinzii 5132]KCB51234.1 hypothetical protein L537_2998 [Bordetella hinzii 1277]